MRANADLSRRSVLKLAAAGSAATWPTVAAAASGRVSSDPAQLSDIEQLIAEIKTTLVRMYPECGAPWGGAELSEHGGMILIAVSGPRDARC